MEERLQKVIARAGIASRRAAEEMIVAGRVRVNGRVVTELGAKADPFKDKIEFDGARIIAEQPHYLVLHKPRNVVSTVRDPEGRPTVAEYFKSLGVRLYPIGRLDFATSGVLLMTNDGEFANALLHPRGGVPKTYVLKVLGVMTEDDAEHWRNGVDLDDGRTLPAELRIMRYEDGKTWLEVTLREGRNQQIRRMGEATGFRVMRLARVSFADVTSDGLRPGQWRPLTRDELLGFRKSYGVPKRLRSAAFPVPPPSEAVRPPARGRRDPAAAQTRTDSEPEKAPAPRERSRRDGDSVRERAPRAGRSDRSETTRREAAPRAARGRGRGGR
jgi:23S rRNA pseudouridine2605 synthase